MNDHQGVTPLSVCNFFFFAFFQLFLRQCGPGRIWRINTSGKKKTNNQWPQQTGCCLSGLDLQQHTHTFHRLNQNSLPGVKTCGLCHSNEVWQRWMWVDVNQFYKQRRQIRFRVKNVINVSATDSFHGGYSELDADSDNYDSDKCQEYDLRNCYAALMDLVLAGVFDQEQWGLMLFCLFMWHWDLMGCVLSPQTINN